MSWPAWPEDVDHTKANVLASLYNLLAWILIGDSTAAVPTEGKFVEMASDKDHRQILSISWDILYCSTTGLMKTPKHISLAMAVHHLTCSTQILSLLNNFGHAIAPSQLIEVDNALTEQELAGRQSGAMLALGTVYHFSAPVTMVGWLTTPKSRLSGWLSLMLPAALLELLKCGCSAGCAFWRFSCRAGLL